VRVLSAGLTRTMVNAEVLSALSEIGLDASRQSSKTLEDVRSDVVDEVIVLAEDAWTAAARQFPNAVHHFWPMDDPIGIPDPGLIPAAVRSTRDELQARLQTWFQGGKVCH